MFLQAAFQYSFSVKYTCLVTALKHSPSKRKSLSRPLRAHEELDSNSKLLLFSFYWLCFRAYKHSLVNNVNNALLMCNNSQSRGLRTEIVLLFYFR